MALSPRITAAVANAMLDAGIGTVVNSGKLAIYDGTQPASGGGSITTQVKLAEFTLPADAFPAAASGVLTLNPVPSVVALAAGTATWFRMTTSGATAIIDGSVGEADADCIIEVADIELLDVVAILSLTITMPQS